MPFFSLLPTSPGHVIKLIHSHPRSAFFIWSAHSQKVRVLRMRRRAGSLWFADFLLWRWRVRVVGADQKKSGLWDENEETRPHLGETLVTVYSVQNPSLFDSTDSCNMADVLKSSSQPTEVELEDLSIGVDRKFAITLLFHATLKTYSGNPSLR